MFANAKRSLVLKNRTCYFNPDTSRVKVCVSSPYSYQYREVKIESFEARLYWQFKYCEEHLGQTFFYTLTYNDSAIPKPYGFNCFDYEDLRDLLTGGFRKQLLRKFGTKFKYFVGAELGDGKGKRGMANNPHYHILFFLEDAQDKRYPYKVIEPNVFRHLVKLYWQGFDENATGFQDYRSAKYGIAREGDNCGKVKDFRAIAYVAKYVCKDIGLKRKELNVESFIRVQSESQYKYSESSYYDYFRSRIFELFNIPRNPERSEWTFSEVELVKRLLPDKVLRSLGGIKYCVTPYWSYVSMIIRQYDLWEDYAKFVDSYVQSKIDEALKEYRNRYCNKVRVSHGIGDYALPTFDKNNPLVKVPSNYGEKARPIGLYYYRKLFCDTVKDSRTGNNMYILNSDGMRFKANRLKSQVHKLADKTKGYFDAVVGNSDLFLKMRQSDVNVDVHLDYEGFLLEMDFLTKDISLYELFKRYAEYKLVYENRFFSLSCSGDSDAYDFPPIVVDRDYLRFLVPSFLSVSRNDLMLDCFLENTPENYLPYYSHPYFLRYIGVFAVFDLFSDYFFIQTDNKKEQDAKRIAETKRFHSKRNLTQYYLQFINS